MRENTHHRLFKFFLRRREAKRHAAIEPVHLRRNAVGMHLEKKGPGGGTLPAIIMLLGSLAEAI